MSEFAPPLAQPELITGVPPGLSQQPDIMRPEFIEPLAPESYRIGLVERSKSVIGKLFSKAGISIHPVAENDANYQPLTAEERSEIGAVEPLPVSYIGTETRGINQNIAKNREKGPLKGVLETLRQELAFDSKESPGPLEHGYRIIRNIADVKFSKMDGTGKVLSLLSASRSNSRPTKYEGFQMAEDGEGRSLGWHSEANRSIGITREHWLQESEQLLAAMGNKGIKLNSEGDHQLIAFMNTLAHETGHNVLAGISGMLRERNGTLNGSSSNIATASYMKDNPNRAITGNWQTDVKTHEERFSEGYAGFVMDSILGSLGYDKKAKMAILSYFWDKTAVTQEVAGRHVVDMIDEVSGDKSLADVAKEKGFESSIANGDLGYTMPLTPQEMLEELTYFDTELRDFEKPQERDTVIPPEKWQELVNSSRDKQTLKTVKGQQEIRRHLANGRSKKPTSWKNKRAQRKIQSHQSQAYKKMGYESAIK